MPKHKASAGIRLRGVRHNNLKGFDLDLPLGKLIVITGPSGSGKSSLAFDTLFAEGQRRYIETFSPYARQFFERMDKPQADQIQGIPPAIAIEQSNTVRTTRSTVGTMTEICDYMKMLWLHFAQLYCRGCGEPVRRDSPSQIWDIIRGADLAEVLITFALPLSDKLSLAESLGLITKQGYQRILVGDDSPAGARIVRVEEAGDILRNAVIPALTIIQDRVKTGESNRTRFVEACEQAYHFGKGRLSVCRIQSTDVQGPAGISRVWRFSQDYHCAACDITYREPSPAMFSFNHPMGACPACRGFGRVITIDYPRAIPDRSKTLAEGAIKPWQSGMSAECQDDLLQFCRKRKVPTDVPLDALSQEHQDWVLNGDPDYGKDPQHEWPHAWYGVKGYFRWLESKAYKMHVRVLLSRYRAYQTCPDCQGSRFQPETRLYRWRIPDEVHGPAENRSTVAAVRTEAKLEPSRRLATRVPRELTLSDFYQLPLRDTLSCLETMARQYHLRAPHPLWFALEEVRSRLAYLVQVGLGYLTLDRPTRTLSGGETERVNLTTCLGTRLVNTLFVLDEPSVGLHPRDTARLVEILEQLRQVGNTVVVVEHEAGVIRAADQIVDLGPGHGESGGHLVFQGTFNELLRCEHSLTGQYLSGKKRIEIPPRRPVSGNARRRTGPSFAGGLAPELRLDHASRHNLKDLTVAIPLNRLVCITGVSGSGKTTLVREVLLPLLAEKLQGRPATAGSEEGGGETEQETEETAAMPAARLAGWDRIRQVVLVDQSPLGKTPRSNPAVYIGAFEAIRAFYAASDAARQRGLGASAFSFNSAQGQCERCRGAGFEKIEMQFLSDVFIRCPDCGGRRYRSHVLEARLPDLSRATGAGSRDWSIADMLEATVDEAIVFLSGYPEARPAQNAVRDLRLLQEVGLGYLRLGQPLNTLSGGECQRLKLVSHLAEVSAIAAREEGPGRQSHGASALVSAGGHGRRTDSASIAGLRKDSILFLFDEPTTGLHFDDIRVLLGVFQRLVDAGNSVVVIEHNLDVIKSADWVIDLGPEAGDAGGNIVVQGTPEQVAACAASHTGRFLRDVFSRRLATRQRTESTCDISPRDSGLSSQNSLRARRGDSCPEVS
jgi:excinuclease ABC subunit A